MEVRALYIDPERELIILLVPNKDLVDYHSAFRAVLPEHRYVLSLFKRYGGTIEIWLVSLLSPD